jgi:hypothetical protein
VWPSVGPAVGLRAGRQQEEFETRLRMQLSHNRGTIPTLDRKGSGLLCRNSIDVPIDFRIELPIEHKYRAASVYQPFIVETNTGCGKVTSFFELSGLKEKGSYLAAPVYNKEENN